MKKDCKLAQSRKYVIKLDNIEHIKVKKTHFNLRFLRILLHELKSLSYFCYSYGISEAGDTVVFIYVEFSSPVRMETLENNMAPGVIIPVQDDSETNKDKIYTLCEEFGYVECVRFEKRILHPEVLNI